MKHDRFADIKERLADRQSKILGSEEYFKSAVLLPLIVKEDGIHVLFEVRSRMLRRQPGEVCFPGGKIDREDESPEQAALRETCEELGIKKEDMEVIGPLDYMVTPFQTAIYPFAGWIKNPDAIVPNEGEVGEVFTVPLSFFEKNKPDRYDIHFKVEPEQGFPYHLIENGEDYNWRTGKMPEYFYQYEGKVIWGLTARILYHFLSLTEK